MNAATSLFFFFAQAQAAGTGVLAVTLGAATLAGTGVAPVTATLNVTLESASGSGSGAVAVTGQGAGTLDAATAAGTGAAAVSATLNVTLGAATLAATGELGLPPDPPVGIIDLLAVRGGDIELLARSACDSDSTWRHIGTLPIAMSGVVAADFDGAFWALGNATRKVYRSVGPSAWLEVGTNAFPFAVAAPVLLVFDDKLWVIGGYSVGESAPDDVRVETYWTIDGLTWTRGNDLPFRITQAAGAVFDGKMWVIGGLRGPTTPPYDLVNSRKVFWSNGGPWTEAGVDALPEAVVDGAAFILSDTLWLVGGFNGGGFVEAAFQSLDGAAWSEAGAFPFTRTAPTVAVVGSRVLLIGGDDENGAVITAKVYASLDVSTWTELVNTPLPQAVALGAAVVRDETLLLVGGYTGTDTLDTVYEFSVRQWPIDLTARVDDDPIDLAAVVL